MGETVHSVLLLVTDGEPAGLEGIVADQDFTGWSWEVAGGPFCLVTDVHGHHWAFEPEPGTYWDRPYHRVFGGEAHLLGQIRPIVNLDEWQGLAAYAARLETIRLQAIAATRIGAGTRRINHAIKACIEAGKAAYTAIVVGGCPVLAADHALSLYLPGATEHCTTVFTGTEEGVLDMGELFLWACHLELGHDGNCDATQSATDHCCVPGVLPSARGGLAPPYERADWPWGSYLPQAAADLAR